MTWRVVWSTANCMDYLEEFSNPEDASFKFDSLKECDEIVCILLSSVIDEVLYFIDSFKRTKNDRCI